jgi:wyosine [tRNA(Phe)-imidazoG37] synthetase (radical SAM superfamily)
MISFGPVPSRRLGKSLGINNIMAPKVCSYNCLYCQVGRSRHQTIARQEFFEPELIFNTVSQHILKLKAENYPDYLTFVSNGEPTIDIKLGKSIKLLKKLNIPIAVISNGALLFQESVRDDLCLADWVSLKIDSGENKIWQTINQPAEGLNFETIMTCIDLFARKFKGILCTETMLVKGINDSQENITNIAEFIKTINPAKAYLSIPTRPTAVKNVIPADIEKLNRTWQIFDNHNILTEYLTGFEGTDTGYTGNIYNDILNMTAVHPLREDSMQKLLQNDNADFQVVTSLINQHLIKSTFYNGNKYYLREYNIQI